MKRTIRSLAAVTAAAGLCLLVSAPAASAALPDNDYQLTVTVSTPTIAPGAGGQLTITIGRTGGTANAGPQTLQVDRGEAGPGSNTRFLTVQACGGDCQVATPGRIGEVVQVQRTVYVDAAAPAGVDIAGGTVALFDYQGQRSAEAPWSVRTAGVAGVPLASPLIGGAAVLLLAAGYVLRRRRVAVAAR